MNSTISTNFLLVNNNFHPSEPSFVIHKYNMLYDKHLVLNIYFSLSLVFQSLLLVGCLFLNIIISSSTRSRKESECCLYILLIYGVFINFPPPLLYELVLSNDFYSIIHISAEIPKNLSVFFRILSIYIVVLFAFNCYHIVFGNSTKNKYSKFYIYFSIALLLIFSSLLTLLLWFLRYFWFDESNPYCHFNIMASVQSLYCPETVYWLMFILLVYIIPVFILFLIYPMVIYKVVKKYEFFECGYVKYLVNNNEKKYLFRPDYQFLKMSFAIALLFLLTNIPFVVIEILCLLQFKVNMKVAISFEIIARYASAFYPWICIIFKCKSGKSLSITFYKFMHPELYNKKATFATFGVSLLADCESTIKEQEELLKVMRVDVKTVPATEVKTKLMKGIQVHCEEM